MGEVFKARHRRLHRVAAVKVVSRKRVGHANAVQRFLREAEAAAHLSHPNIVAVYDFGEEGDTHYLAMEYIDGVDLGRLLVQEGPLPVALACDFMRQAALGLHHAHEQGFVHRDIKPQNLLVAPRRAGRPAGNARAAEGPRPQAASEAHGGAGASFNRYAGGTVKVLDMGLIRQQEDRVEATEMALTQYGVVIGTMDYLAPEQARNAHRVDRRADLYSLGCTLYHLLAGQPVFPGGTPLEKILCHQSNPPPSIRELRPDVPAELAAVIGEMLAKRPEERTQTAAEAALLLTPFASRAPMTAIVKRKPTLLPPPTSEFANLAPTRLLADEEDKTFQQEAPSTIEAPPDCVPRPRRWWWLLAGAAVILALLAAAALLCKPGAGDRKTPETKKVAGKIPRR